MKPLKLIIIFIILMAALSSSVYVFLVPDVPKSCSPDPHARPDWVGENDPIEKQPFYQRWLTTTTSYCINLHNVEKDNKDNTAIKSIVWNNDDPQWLFSGSELHYPPKEVFKYGYVPGTPDGGKLTMLIGSNAETIKNSGLIYTSRSTKVATGFGKYIYVMHAAGGIDVDRSAGKEPGSLWDEIDFPGGVRRELVRGAFVTTGPEDRAGMPFSHYLPNENYKGYVALPAGYVDVLVNAAGNFAKTIQVSIDGHTPSSDGSYQVKDDESITLRATNADGSPHTTTQWWINGYTSERPASCIVLPMSAHVDHHMVVGVLTKNSNTWPSDGTETCVPIHTSAIKDGHFLEHQVLTGSALRDVTGTFGGWHATRTVMLVSKMSAMLENGQAVSLNHEKNYGPGIAGQIEQHIHFGPSPHWKITFSAGNNTSTWCAEASNYPDQKFTGDQTFKVRLTHPLHGESFVFYEQDFNIGTARTQTASGWMNPDWKTYSIDYAAVNGEHFSDDHPNLQFVSTSESGKACAAMIANVSVEAIPAPEAVNQSHQRIFSTPF